MGKRFFKIAILPMREELLYYAESILKNQNDAEDAVQEVFLKLWTLRKDLKKYENIKGYSVEVTKNICLNRLRSASNKRSEKLDNIRIASEEPTPLVKLENEDNIHQITKIIKQLPNLQQAILKMKHIDGLEVHEIAEITGSNPEAIRMNLYRARKKLKETFFKI